MTPFIEAFNKIKDISEVVKKYNDLDLMKQLIDLQDELAKRQAEAMQLVQQNLEKDEEIKKLKKAMAIKSKMVCEFSAYYQVDDQGNKVDGPFCTNCFDNEFATRRLLAGFQPKGQVGWDWTWVQCPKCKTPFRSEQIGEYLRQH